MAITPPGFVVDGPRPFRPYSKYGLLATFGAEDVDDPHAWAGGVEWEQDLCTEVRIYTESCPPVTGTTNVANRDLEFCQAEPFIVKSSYSCATAGRSVFEAFNIAKRRLLAWESYGLEKAFWTGQAENGPVNPSLTKGNVTCGITPINLSPAGAVSVWAGVAVLEEALTDVVPGGGVLHAPYGLASYLGRYNLIDREDDRYFSITGFPVVVGAGYTGSGPNNVAAEPGTTWIYGTGPVAIWRSEQHMNPAEVAEGIDRYKNDVTVYSERYYVAGYSCALYAVNVAL